MLLLFTWYSRHSPLARALMSKTRNHPPAPIAPWSAGGIAPRHFRSYLVVSMRTQATATKIGHGACRIYSFS